MAIRYVLKQIGPGGLWKSDDVFVASEPRYVSQAVIAGWLAGQPRWAEREDGTFICGLDAKGRWTLKAPAR